MNELWCGVGHYAVGEHYRGVVGVLTANKLEQIEKQPKLRPP